MPSAVLQGFCSLLRDHPPPPVAQRGTHRPYSRGSQGGHDAILGLSKVSKTAYKGHQGRPNGLSCLQDGPR